jgi:hypothetical protein
MRAILTAIISRLSACTSVSLTQFGALRIASFRLWLTRAVEG